MEMISTGMRRAISSDKADFPEAVGPMIITASGLRSVITCLS